MNSKTSVCFSTIFKMLDSSPVSPVAPAATASDCGDRTLPMLAPTALEPTAKVGFMPMDKAVCCCNAPNRTLEDVQEPVTNPPK